MNAERQVCGCLSHSEHASTLREWGGLALPDSGLDPQRQ